MEIYYASNFFKQLNKLESALQEDAFEALELFKNEHTHSKLKVHSLHGKLKGLYSFSVNYKYRILFKYLDKNEVFIIKIGDHDLYN